MRSIHVAGTNGKGSVVAMCDAMLRSCGNKIGRYTSPHLIDFRERVLVNGVPISEQQVLKYLQRMTQLAEKIGATFFELTTALAFAYFDDCGIDIAIIETGLGGRLDSTNVIVPVVATVTSIGLDHTDLLGDTLELIAAEKAGIFKADVPAVIGERKPEIASLLRNAAVRSGAEPIRMVDHEYHVSDVRVTAQGTTFVLDTPLGLRNLRTNLIGFHQAQNAAVAIATVGAPAWGFEPDWKEIEQGLAATHLPGRFQSSGSFIFDVAHNPDAARTLAQTIAAVAPKRPLNAVVAVLSDKNWRGFLDEIAPLVDKLFVTNAPSAPPDRKWDFAAAVEYAAKLGGKSEGETDLEAALTKAAAGGATVLVTGSFHTVGDAMSRLQVSPFAA